MLNIEVRALFFLKAVAPPGCCCFVRRRKYPRKPFSCTLLHFPQNIRCGRGEKSAVMNRNNPIRSAGDNRNAEKINVRTLFGNFLFAQKSDCAILVIPHLAGSKFRLRESRLFEALRCFKSYNIHDLDFCFVNGQAGWYPAEYVEMVGDEPNGLLVLVDYIPSAANLVLVEIRGVPSFAAIANHKPLLAK